jgi:hypothetical protein
MCRNGKNILNIGKIGVKKERKKETDKGSNSLDSRWKMRIFDTEIGMNRKIAQSVGIK